MKWLRNSEVCTGVDEREYIGDLNYRIVSESY